MQSLSSDVAEVKLGQVGKEVQLHWDGLRELVAVEVKESEVDELSRWSLRVHLKTSPGLLQLISSKSIPKDFVENFLL